MSAPKRQGSLRPAYPLAESRRLETAGSGWMDVRAPAPVPQVSDSARTATIASIRARLARAQTSNRAGLAAKLRAELDSELKTAAVYHRAYGHLTSATIGAPSVEQALALPLFDSEARGVTAWACLKAANAATAEACGASTDFTLRYLRENARVCEMNNADAAVVTAVVRDSCAKGAREVIVLGVTATTLPPMLQ